MLLWHLHHLSAFSDCTMCRWSLSQENVGLHLNRWLCRLLLSWALFKISVFVRRRLKKSLAIHKVSSRRLGYVLRQRVTQACSAFDKRSVGTHLSGPDDIELLNTFFDRFHQRNAFQGSSHLGKGCRHRGVPPPMLINCAFSVGALLLGVENPLAFSFFWGVFLLFVRRLVLLPHVLVHLMIHLSLIASLGDVVKESFRQNCLRMVRIELVCPTRPDFNKLVTNLARCLARGA